MIKNKDDLINYIELDKRALGIIKKKPSIVSCKDVIWKYEILLRKCEYYHNCKSFINNIIFKYYYYKFKKLSIKLGFSISLNCFGPGLSIAHYGTIIVNGNAKIGKNCRIHAGVTIGATGGSEMAPQVGDNVYIGSGAKLIGNIKIGNQVCIGANAVVTKSFDDDITIAGVPAVKISDNNSEAMIKNFSE